MILGISQNFKENPYINTNKQRSCLKSQTTNENSFNPSFGWDKYDSSYHSLFLGSPFIPRVSIPNTNVSKLPTTKYAQTISNSINKTSNEKISPQSLNSLMTPEDFRELLPSLTAENFKSTAKNIRDGVYIADLDYERKNNKEEFVPEILDKVAELSNQFYAENRKPFVFALTDRDNVYSIQSAIKIIAKNPEKFQHMKLLPALKLSLGNEEDGGILLYGINPFDEELMDIVDIISKNKLRMIFDYAKKIKEMHPEFSYDILEFYNIHGYSYEKGKAISSLYRKARECEDKGVNRGFVPESIKQQANSILENFKKEYCSFDSQILSKYDFLTNENSGFDESKSFDKYFKRDVNEEIVSSAKSTFKALVQYINKHGEEGNKPVIALCDPYYLSRYFEENGSQTYENIAKVIENLKKESDGLLCAFETVAPDYGKNGNINPSRIEEFNDYIRQHCDLYEVGGSFADLYKPIVYY